MTTDVIPHSNISSTQKHTRMNGCKWRAHEKSKSVPTHRTEIFVDEAKALFLFPNLPPMHAFSKFQGMP